MHAAPADFSLPEKLRQDHVEDHEIDAFEGIGDAPLAIELDLRLQLVDEVDAVEDAGLAAGPNAAACNGDGEMGLAGARPPDQDEIALLVEEGASRPVGLQILWAADRPRTSLAGSGNWPCRPSMAMRRAIWGARNSFCKGPRSECVLNPVMVFQ